MSGIKRGQQVNAAPPRMWGKARPRGIDPTTPEEAPWPKGSAEKQVVTECRLACSSLVGPLHVHEGGLFLGRV